MEPPRWHEDEFRLAFADAGCQVVKSGLVREGSSSTFAECPGCGPGTMGRVHPLMNRRTGTTSFRLPCHNCGLVEIPADSLRVWELDLPAVVSAIVRAVGLVGDPRPFADGRGWHLGRGKWAGRSREAFLVRAVRPERLPSFRERLRHHPHAVVLAATAEDAEARQPHGTQALVRLGDALTFDGTLRADAGRIEDALSAGQPAGRADTQTRGRKKAGLLAKVSRLRAELVEHVRSARRYAFEERDRTGEPRLLRRPTKSKLAELAGVRPDDVTRCFKDPAGRELLLLWEASDDLEQVIRYGG